MGLPNEDEVKGKVEHAVGHVKETVGVATDNDRLADEGRADQLEGGVQDGLGHARRKVGEVIEDIGDSIKR